MYKPYEKLDNSYQLKYVYIMDWYTIIWTWKKSGHSEYTSLTSWIIINFEFAIRFKFSQSF